jgi:putative copper resistance protein D
MEISAQPLSAVFPAVPTVILRTHIGHVWLIRISALILFSITFTAARRYRDSRRFLIFLLGLGVIISMTESASGHASDAGDFSLAEIMDWFHLLSASIWGGGLLTLSVAILPELARHGERIAPVNASVARRFSGIAGFAVGIVAITSLYNAWSYVGSFGAFWKTSYGWTAVAKILLFSLIIYLGAFNRYVSVPLLQRACVLPGRQGFLERIAVHFFPRYLCTEEKSLIFSRFMWSVKVEAVLIVGVLLCAALLRHEVPARHLSHMEHQGGMGHSMPHNDGDSPHTRSDHNDHDGSR